MSLQCSMLRRNGIKRPCLIGQYLVVFEPRLISALERSVEDWSSHRISLVA